MKTSLKYETAAWELPQPQQENHDIRLPRVLLLDDDVLFCRLMTKIGAKRNIPVINCQSCEQFRELARWMPHDVAILDYYLDGNTTAREIAREISARENSVRSLIIISNSEAELDMDRDWPSSVKISISKAMGINAILEAVCAVTYF